MSLRRNDASKIELFTTSQAANDQQPVVPMVEKLQALPAGLNQPAQLLTAAGYFSAANVDACAAAGIAPLMAVKRDEPHPPVSARCDEPPELPAHPTPVQRRTRRLQTGAGSAADALRKSSVEPVFGIITSVRGFRQLLTRGLDNVQGEWTLVCLAWNLKRLAVWRPQ